MKVYTPKEIQEITGINTRKIVSMVRNGIIEPYKRSSGIGVQNLFSSANIGQIIVADLLTNVLPPNIIKFPVGMFRKCCLDNECKFLTIKKYGAFDYTKTLDFEKYTGIVHGIEDGECVESMGLSNAEAEICKRGERGWCLDIIVHLEPIAKLIESIGYKRRIGYQQRRIDCIHFKSRDEEGFIHIRCEKKTEGFPASASCNCDCSGYCKNTKILDPSEMKTIKLTPAATEKQVKIS